MQTLWLASNQKGRKMPEKKIPTLAKGWKNGLPCLFAGCKLHWYGLKRFIHVKLGLTWAVELFESV